MYQTMILFKTNGPVKIHIQWTITKSMYSRLQLWLVLRTVVVTSACLIPSFHCPSSRWISPRMLWNIKEKRVRFTTESELSFITHGNHFYRFIQQTCTFYKDLIKDLITDSSVLTHWQHNRDPRRQKTSLWSMGLNFWWHCTPIYNIQGVDTQ